MKTLPIVWKRLVADGRTCPRCASTQEAVLGAMAKLQAALQPLGIRPTLDMQALDDPDFRADPSESNRLWIAGRPLEEWLGGCVGTSPCCTVCGDLSCRTVQVGGRVYEAIPEELIVRAALRAASAMTGVEAAAARASPACCTSRCDGR